MFSKYIHTSLTRIAHFMERSFTIEALPKDEWATGDYVVAEVIENNESRLKAELVNGRMMDVMKGDLLIGALGTRFATLEATGSWEDIEEDGQMHLLTGAGLFGKLTSHSIHTPQVIELQYKGHIKIKGMKSGMRDFIPDCPFREFTIPVVLLVGTSMSAGKTTAARIVTRQLKLADKKVVGAKLAGAGRYRDILSVYDAGADEVFDFVDVGLPSTICPRDEYMEALKHLLSLMQRSGADVAVVEIGASPLEPYNGQYAIEAIRENIRCTILCASDPYAVYGVMKSYGMRPDLVSGIATNTLAGIQLVEKLAGVRAINIIDPAYLPDLREVLFDHVLAK
jgi:hypothetical protein